ncbi:MAG: Lrp/AsnC family transcriptional regulator [Syntrophomonadaceae bacterium]|jgi:DNA-binding Lrp family transcriptional regulator|nr:Lrp/AsnC family transcriptional regulator [Syntrophomonadaceae bacterium]
MNSIDSMDRKLLDILQKEFPLTTRPWAEISSIMGLDEQEITGRIEKLKQKGIIRRIGGVFDSRQLGFYSTLCAARVDEQDVERVAGLVNDYPGVTHNYLRDHEYNLWFTLTAPSEAEARQQLKELEKAAGITILSLPARKVYKIRVAFPMGDNAL